jgi:hypothetical protein
MARVEKTVFISYRRANFPWAMAVYQDLTQNGYDVFFDIEGIASGDFEQVILQNIRSRAHFLVVLTPSALERVTQPGDWLLREIETALECERNIVPLLLEGFNFNTAAIADRLTGQLALLKSYNGLTIPSEYFPEAMERLRGKFLNVPLEAVLRPASPAARRAAKKQKAAAKRSPQVNAQELTAQEWFERGKAAENVTDQMQFYDEAIRLDSNLGPAYYYR